MVGMKIAVVAVRVDATSYVILYRAVLKGDLSRAMVLRIAEMEFLVSAYVCFIRCAQFSLPGALMSVRIRALRHGQRIILPLPSKL